MKKIILYLIVTFSIIGSIFLLKNRLSTPKQEDSTKKQNNSVLKDTLLCLDEELALQSTNNLQCGNIITSKFDSNYQLPKLVDSLTFFQDLKDILSNNMIKKGEENWIDLDFTVDTIGNVIDTEIITSLDGIGYSPSKLQQFLRDTKWTPLVHRGKRIESKMEIFVSLWNNGICSINIFCNTYTWRIYSIHKIPF